MNAANMGVLTGYVVKPPERRGEKGPYILRVAVDGAGNTMRDTGYFNVAMFSDRFEKVIPYLNKGKRVSISYGLRHSTWQTTEGQNRSSVELQAGDIQFISSARAQDGAEAGGGRTRTTSSTTSAAPGGGGPVAGPREPEDLGEPWEGIDF